MIPFNGKSPVYVEVGVDCGLPANVGIHPVELPIYRPVEDLMPLWRTARIIMGAQIPQQLQFKRDEQDRNIVGLDLEWLNRMYWLAPPEDSPVMARLATDVVQLWEVAEDASSYDHMLGKAITPQNLLIMAAILESHDQQRRARGWPTLLEIAKHILGLEPAPGTVVRQIEIEPGVRP